MLALLPCGELPGAPAIIRVVVFGSGGIRLSCTRSPSSTVRVMLTRRLPSVKSSRVVVKLGAAGALGL
jgi:hypothetical protein